MNLPSKNPLKALNHLKSKLLQANNPTDSPFRKSSWESTSKRKYKPTRLQRNFTLKKWSLRLSLSMKPPLLLKLIRKVRKYGWLNLSCWMRRKKSSFPSTSARMSSSYLLSWYSWSQDLSFLNIVSANQKLRSILNRRKWRSKLRSRSQPQSSQRRLNSQRSKNSR